MSTTLVAHGVLRPDGWIQLLDPTDLPSEECEVEVSLIREQIRTHQIYGWYFLPNLPESLVDLRDLPTMRCEFLEELIADGKRVARLLTPYREHLAQHFATTYARIALPEPYETEA